MIPPGNEPGTFRLVAHCLNKQRLPALERKCLLFFCTSLFNQRFQPSEVFLCNTNHYDSYGKAMFNTQIASWYRMITTDQGIASELSICFAVTSRVLPPTEHKINKRT